MANYVALGRSEYRQDLIVKATFMAKIAGMSMLDWLAVYAAMEGDPVAHQILQEERELQAKAKKKKAKHKAKKKAMKKVDETFGPPSP